jgi:hypothetical protein
MPEPSVTLTAKSARAVKWLLNDAFATNTKQNHYVHPSSYLLGEFIGHDGIFVLRHGKSTPLLTEEHGKWYHQRKQAAKIFTRRAFNELMYSTFKSKAVEFVDILNAHRNSDKADEALDMQELYSMVCVYLRVYVCVAVCFLCMYAASVNVCVAVCLACIYVFMFVLCGSIHVCLYYCYQTSNTFTDRIISHFAHIQHNFGSIFIHPTFLTRN